MTISSSGNKRKTLPNHAVMHMNDLPDSFAPLLSSSQMEVFDEPITADLIHAVNFRGGIKLRPGRHEMPLDKDPCDRN
jgi:hypothetical protein